MHFFCDVIFAISGVILVVAVLEISIGVCLRTRLNTSQGLAELPMANALRATRMYQHLFADGPSEVASRAVRCVPLA